MKLLWLYDDLLDLYGDRGNMVILCARLKEAGFEVEVDRKSIGDEVDFSAYRFVYIGPGLISNAVAALEDIRRHQKSIEDAIAAGTVFFVIGSAQVLFCRSLLSADGQTHHGLGLFDLDLVEGNTITAADIVCTHPEIPSKIYGFINNTITVSNNGEEELFTTVYRGQGCKIGDKIGLRCNNFFSTWLLGPLLVRNPDLLCWLLRIITGKEVTCDDALERSAYEALMRELGQL